MTFAPTFIGFIPETHDALLLFQAVINGTLSLVTSRPPENERANVIRSGAVYIFKEGTIKRWTDKVCWSPSRVLGNFLIYRELGSKRSRSSTLRTMDMDPSRSLEDPRRCGPSYQQPSRGRNVEFSLYGSLVDSYDFKPDGLVKKTISTTFEDETYRLISYYTVDDVQSERLLSPMEYPELMNIEVDARLANGIQFQMPLNTITPNEYGYDDGEVTGEYANNVPVYMPPALVQANHQPNDEIRMMPVRLEGMLPAAMDPTYPMPIRSEPSTAETMERAPPPQFLGYDYAYAMPPVRGFPDQYAHPVPIHAPYDLTEQITTYPMQDVQGMQGMQTMAIEEEEQMSRIPF